MAMSSVVVVIMAMALLFSGCGGDTERRAPRGVIEACDEADSVYIAPEETSGNGFRYLQQGVLRGLWNSLKGVDPAYFSKIFRQIEGITPTQYRNRPK